MILSSLQRVVEGHNAKTETLMSVLKTKTAWKQYTKGIAYIEVSFSRSTNTIYFCKKQVHGTVLPDSTRSHTLKCIKKHLNSH